MSEQYISQLTKVFEILNTLEENINRNVNTEQDEVMFGYSSDSTESNASLKPNTEEASSRPPEYPSTSTPPPNQPYRQESFTERVKSRNSDRKRRERDYFDLDDDYESGYSQGYIRSEGRWKNPTHNQFTPKNREASTKYDLLDLDCLVNPLKYFEDWIAATQIEIATNTNIQKMSHLEFFKYLEYKSTGVVRNYFSDYSQEMITTLLQEMTNEGDTPSKWFTIFVQRAYLEFFGKDILNHRKEVDKEENNQAVWFLTNIKLCNMCYLDEFICSYRRYFYDLTRDQRNMYINVFLQKIPYPLSVKVNNYFEEQKAKGALANTLGGAIQAVKAIQTSECLNQQVRKHISHNLECCEKNMLVPPQFGCNTGIKKKHFSKK